MKLTLFLLLLLNVSAGAAFTEFYFKSGGSNLNAGSTVDNAAELTSTNGGWNSGTGVFTCSGATDLSGVAAGEFASVYLDAATTTAFVGRITAVDDGADTVTVSITIKSGTVPTTAGSGLSIKVGGAWAGPSGATHFPLDFADAAMVNSSGHPLRVNFTGTFSTTGTITPDSTGPIFWQGYGATPGDETRATIDGGTSGNYRKLMALGNVDKNYYIDIVFSGNGGASTGASGVFTALADARGEDLMFLRCVFTGMGGSGLDVSERTTVIECEGYGNGLANGTGTAGLSANRSGTVIINCMGHDNAGSNVAGFKTDGGILMYRCVSENNGGSGTFSTGDVAGTYYQSDFYGNGGSGFNFANSDDMLQTIISCNFLDNARYAVETGGTQAYNGIFYNNAIGSGSTENTLGSTDSFEGMLELGTVTLTAGATPYSSPAGGNFNLTHADVINGGRGRFTFGGVLSTTNISYPDTGASQQ